MNLTNEEKRELDKRLDFDIKKMSQSKFNEIAMIQKRLYIYMTIISIFLSISCYYCFSFDTNIALIMFYVLVPICMVFVLYSGKKSLNQEVMNAGKILFIFTGIAAVCILILSSWFVVLFAGLYFCFCLCASFFIFQILYKDSRQWVKQYLKKDFLDRTLFIKYKKRRRKSNANSLKIKKVVVDYKEIDREILRFFSDNKFFIDAIIIPVVKIAHKLGFFEKNITKCIRDAYSLFKLTEKGYHLKSIIDDLKNKFINQLNSIEQSNFSQFKTYRSNKDFDWFVLLRYGERDRDSFLESHFKTINEDGWRWLKSFEETRLKITFLKLFYHLNLLNKIEENAEFVKILINCYKKFSKNSCDHNETTLIIAEKTYELFFDYFDMNKHKITFEVYKECIFQFWVRFHSEEHNYYEVSHFEFNFYQLDMYSITDKIIEEKLYLFCDATKLINGFLFEKCKSFTFVTNMIHEILCIDEYKRKIDKQVLKEELLEFDIKKEEEARIIAAKKEEEARIIADRKKQEEELYYSTTMSDIDLMSGVQFEEFLCKYFTKQGYMCKLTKASGDQGVDIIAKKAELIIAIQAKHYSSNVGNKAVQEVAAGMKYYKANRGMVITNSYFTQQAIDLANVNNIRLWDRNVLSEKLKSR